MKVLLLESYEGWGTAAADELSRAGHQVLRCASISGDAPCRGLEAGGKCPLDADDVAVAVVATTRGRTTFRELGVMCAARQRIPIVSTAVVPDREVFERIASGDEPDLPGACDAAMRSGAAHESAVVRELLRLGTIGPDDVDGRDPAITITVQREPRRLAMSLRIPTGDPRETAIVKSAAEALRAYDRHVPVIDVSVVR